jgi:hypothetical protein
MNEPVLSNLQPSTEGTITLLLRRAQNLDLTIAASIPNRGSYTWSIPRTLKGGGFTIVLTSPSSSKSISGEFTISPVPVSTVILVITSTRRNATTLTTFTTTSSRPPSTTDTTLYIDTAPTPTAVVPSLVITDGGPKSPHVGIIAGATVGACVVAAAVLTGAIVVARRRRARDDGESFGGGNAGELDSFNRNLDGYGRPRGMANAF